MAACSGIAGSTKNRKKLYHWWYGWYRAGHLTIADNTLIGAYTGITNNIKEEGQAFQGIPAMPASKNRRSFVYTDTLPELQQTVLELQKRDKPTKRRTEKVKKMSTKTKNFRTNHSH